MKAVSLKAFPRTLTRRGGAKHLRSHGRVPAVIYGGRGEPANLEVSAKEFSDLVHHSASETILVDLTLEADSGGSELALIQEIQHHPLSGGVLHVDFHRVAADEPVAVTLPVESVGTAAGVKTGGVLEHVLFKLRVRGLPRNLPEIIEVDVSALEVGQSVHVRDLTMPEGITVMADPDLPVISVAAPLTEVEEAAAEEGTGAPLGEPEVIKEKKEEGEGAKSGDKGGDKPK